MLKMHIQNDKILIGRLKKGDDLLIELTKICERENIPYGKVEGIGAVSCANLGYYDQVNKRYLWNKIDDSMEVLSFIGNISIKDNKTFIHAHIVLGDESGKAVGGHLGEGTKVFAFEYIIFPFKGGKLIRDYDEDTGLFLWTL